MCAKDLDNFFQALKKVLEKLDKFNIELNPQKTDLCARIITWCGRKMSTDALDTIHIFQLVVNLPEPKTSAEIQRFLAVANWVRR